MEERIEQILQKSRLFVGMSRSQMENTMALSGSRICEYKKGEFVFCQGDTATKMCILIDGEVVIAKMGSTGKRTMLTTIRKPGDMFGEIFLFIGTKTYEVEAQALKHATVLELSNQLFMHYEAQASEIEVMLMQNLLQIFAMKAYQLNGKVRLLGSSTLREKIALFLTDHVREDGSVKSRYNREELAEYMNVTRPSLSRELGNMASEGILLIQGREIKILDMERLEEYL